MCGIVGILGRGPVADQLVDSLRRLEYRGYDSAGIATLEGAHLARRRAEGKLRNLAGVLPPPELDTLMQGLGEDEQYRLPDVKQSFIQLLLDKQLPGRMDDLFVTVSTLNVALSRKHSPLSLAVKYGTQADYDWLVEQGASPDYVVDGDQSPGDLMAARVALEANRANGAAMRELRTADESQ